MPALRNLGQLNQAESCVVHVPRFRTRQTCGIEKGEAQLAGRWAERLGLHARLVLRHAIVRQPQVVAVEVVHGDHGVGRAQGVVLEVLEHGGAPDTTSYRIRDLLPSGALLSQSPARLLSRENAAAASVGLDTSAAHKEPVIMSHAIVPASKCNFIVPP
jgi:hypothetical protein